MKYALHFSPVRYFIPTGQAGHGFHRIKISRGKNCGIIKRGAAGDTEPDRREIQPQYDMSTYGAGWDRIAEQTIEVYRKALGA